MNRKYTGVLPLDHRGVESIANFPVDVLAVMDELIDFDERHPVYEPQAKHKAHAARAAVAGLIEAIGPALYELRDKSEAKKDLIAALSRVKGT